MSLVSLSSSRTASQTSLLRSISKLSLSEADGAVGRAGVWGLNSSASSSQMSLSGKDEENVTIKRSIASMRSQGDKQSAEDLRLLAVSTHMTEISYALSDIQTRIFEIQELRHQSHTENDNKVSTSVIDQTLMNLDERLESVNQGMKAVDEVLKPSMSSSEEGSGLEGQLPNETRMLVRKHAELTEDWEAVLNESAVLREELKEDKWLTVFRTVNEQADGMMSSLEKAIKRCQDFIWQVQRRGTSEDSLKSPISPGLSAKNPVDYETFCTLLDSFEAKKKHYIPATSKVLSIIDKGVQDRVTKNGECLRRHAESTQRWKTLRERIERTDADMERVRKVFVKSDIAPSESGSTASGKTSKSSKAKAGYLLTPPSSESVRSRASSAGGTLSRSISPFRRFAQKIRNGTKTPGRSTPTQASAMKRGKSAPTSEPVPSLQHRVSVLALRTGSQDAAATPDRPTHKYSHSFTPESPTMAAKRANATSISTMKGPPPKWNSSTKIVDDGYMTAKHTPRRPSISNIGSTFSPPAHSTRSPSRSSLASSRPFSPMTLTSSVNSSMTSTTTDSRFTSTTGVSRPPSRAQSPGTPASIRVKSRHSPSTASSRIHCDTSAGSSITFDNGSEMSTSIMQRAISPTYSVSGQSAISSSFRTHTPGGTRIPHPRPPSRSMIPIPSVQISSVSRPPSAMSTNERSNTSMSIRSVATRSQTPETTLRKRASQIPFFPDAPRSAPRRMPSQIKLPPSSFRDGVPSISRPPSRSASATPGLDFNPVHKYVPMSLKDPLDVEVAAIVNSVPHGLLIERVDPPMRGIAAEGEEIKAQYAFSNALARKVVNCKLATMTRSGPKGQTITKKVMCRVGGGWQDLQMYMLNRQSGF